MKDKRCKTCKFAVWQLTEKGNVRRSQYGTCDVLFVKPLFPSAYSITFHKSAIWPNTGKDCSYYEAKP